MKYWDMIKVVGHPISCPVTPQQPYNSSNDPGNTVSVDVATSLDEYEVSKVMDMMMVFKDKYFSEIPIMGELQKSFVWNIPKELYDLSRSVWETGKADGLNPIYWFYMFCIEPSPEAIAKFIVTAYNAMKDTEFDEIEALADEYDVLNDIDDYEVDDDDIVSFAEINDEEGVDEDE